MTIVIDGHTLGRDFANPLRTGSHGGGCCGVKHLSNFSSTYRAYLTHPKNGIPRYISIPISAELIKDAVSKTTQFQTQGILVEAVLTNTQLKDPVVAEAIQDAGFKLVSRFKNPNSGNICNVFHYNQVPRSTTGRLPFKVKKEES